jgi:hypothetical protein
MMLREGLSTRQGEDAPPMADGFGRSRLKPDAAPLRGDTPKPQAAKLSNLKR